MFAVNLFGSVTFFVRLKLFEVKNDSRTNNIIMVDAIFSWMCRITWKDRTRMRKNIIITFESISCWFDDTFNDDWEVLPTLLRRNSSISFPFVGAENMVRHDQDNRFVLAIMFVFVVTEIPPHQRNSKNPAKLQSTAYIIEPARLWNSEQYTFPFNSNYYYTSISLYKSMTLNARVK